MIIFAIFMPHKFRSIFQSIDISRSRALGKIVNFLDRFRWIWNRKEKRRSHKAPPVTVKRFSLFFSGA
ncbi:MAG: hypothetical protein CMM52_01295 [Rhodospirillaceae bacterium]|nr:hypothetical protein [Rhodospirillaceae bacterium]